MSKRIAVGLSGGVDSSVAALLLREQGFDVQAVFMKNWEDDDREGYCHAAEDMADAGAVARRLDIPLHRRNFTRAYREEVFAHFLRELRAGLTPNPDVLCNPRIKFGRLLDCALALGAEKLATGHYARVVEEKGRYRLLRGVDGAKDQSYFLYALDQHQLSRALFPVGHLTKREVRRMAERAGLVTYDKKDSTGLCFIGERDFAAFIARYLPEEPGPITTPEGEVLGTHRGLPFYTLGQRKGLGLSGGPWYVARKVREENRLVVVRGHDHPLLMSRRLVAGSLCWTAGEPPKTPLRLEAKTRYRQPAQPCTLFLEGDKGRVAFDEPQRAVTPGQAVVFYRGEECLGGGTIEAAHG